MAAGLSIAEGEGELRADIHKSPNSYCRTQSTPRLSLSAFSMEIPASQDMETCGRERRCGGEKRDRREREAEEKQKQVELWKKKRCG